MLDIGWTELLVIGVVALIVVGPKDLPVMFRNLGRFTGRLRGMARDFSRAMDDAADQAGAKDLARDLRTMSNPRAAGTQAFKKAAGLDDLDPFGEDDDGDVPAKTHGPNTAALAEKRAAEAKQRREEAVARANARASQGFDPNNLGNTNGEQQSPPAEAEATAEASPPPVATAAEAPEREAPTPKQDTA